MFASGGPLGRLQRGPGFFGTLRSPDFSLVGWLQPANYASEPTARHELQPTHSPSARYVTVPLMCEYQSATTATDQHKNVYNDAMPNDATTMVWCVITSILHDTGHHLTHTMTPLSSTNGYVLRLLYFRMYAINLYYVVITSFPVGCPAGRPMERPAGVQRPHGTSHTTNDLMDCSIGSYGIPEWIGWSRRLLTSHGISHRPFPLTSLGTFDIQWVV